MKKSIGLWQFWASAAALALIIHGANSFVSEFKERVPPTQVTVIPLTPANLGGLLVINDNIHELACGPAGKVLSAVIEVEISGGVLPYYVEFDPGDDVIPNLQGSIIRLTLDGGKSSTIRVKSAAADGQLVSKDVHAPSHDPKCADPTSIAISTDTPTPTSTDTLTPTPTDTPTPTKDKDPVDQPLTNTPTSTPTSNDPTSIPTTNPTSTPTSNDPTSTPTTKPTSTPTSNDPTSTPTTKPTSTPTPTTHPNLAECEDGMDNDNDGAIDLDDKQCDRGSDNHEDH